MNLFNMNSPILKKNKIKYLRIIVIFLTANYLSAQNAPEYSGKEYNIGVFPKAAEASSLGKYTDIPASVHTGIMNFSIPIYDVEINGVKFPISLNYNTSSIKLDETASRVGLGWHLNIGGISLSKQVLGAWDNIENNTKIKIPFGFNPNGSLTNPQTQIGLAITGTTANAANDLEPDMYSYSLFSYGGKFILDFQKDKILTIPYTPIKSELFTNSNIILKDDKGISYNFYGIHNAYSESTCPNTNEFGPPNYVSEFIVNEITFPNEQKITYEYANQNLIPGLRPSIKYGTSVVQNHGLSIQYLPPTGTGALTQPPVAPVCRNSINDLSYEHKILKKLNFPYCSIDFIYSAEVGEGFRKDIVDDVYLKKILVKDLDGNIIKEFVLDLGYFVSDGNFDYTENYNRGNNFRLKLNGIEEIKSGQKHIINYYEGNLPPRMTDHKDFWGVYNGANNNTSIGSGKYYYLGINQETRTYNSGNDLRPNINFAKIGNLKSIQYPTGGTINIEYELDDFYVLNWYKDALEILGTLYESNYSKSGTLRVSKVFLDNGDGGRIIREFTYINPTTSKSSGRNYGTMNLTPIVTNFADITPLLPGGPSYQLYNYATNNAGWQLGVVDGKQVGYTHIQEKIINFSNPIENYKIEYEYFHNSQIEEDEWTTYDPNSVINMSYPMFYPERGLLRYKKYFNSTNQIVKIDSIFYEFDEYHNRLSTSKEPNNLFVLFEGAILRKHYIKSVNYGVSSIGFFEKYFPYKTYWIKTLENHTTEYLPNGESIQKTTYNYSPTYKHIYPVNTINTNSFGEILRTEYQYPQDLPLKPNADKLIAANRISEPLVVKSFNGSTQLSEQETQYREFTVSTSPLKKLVLPEFVYAKKGSNNLEKKITYNSYDAQGNLTQYTLENGTPVSIIWGYNGQYPIAKVEGALYTSLSTYISTLQTASNGGTLTATSFDSLLNLSGAVVTCYIYKPLVGVTTIIQPNGQKEIYEYDGSGRLMQVKDHNGSILKKMDYHYKN